MSHFLQKLLWGLFWLPTVALAANPELYYGAPRCGSPNQLVVAFKSGAGYANLNTATTNVATNFSVSGRTVTSAQFDASSNSAILTLNSNLANLTKYTVNVANIKDINGATISSSSDSLYYSTNENGLVGEYFSGKTLSGSADLNFDSTLDVDFNSGFFCLFLPFLCGGDKSARWKGFLKPSVTGGHVFQTITNDGSRLWVNNFNTSIIDYWGTDGSSNVTRNSSSQTLTKDVYYPIKQEFYYDQQGFIFYDTGHMELRWTPPGSGNGVIPSARLSTCVAVTGAPTLSHFNIVVPASASACGTVGVTITAIGTDGNILTNYTGTINLTTGSGKGDWSKSVANGAINNGTSGDGAAAYTFAAGDNGVINLSLDHPYAVSSTVTAAAEGKSNTSSSIQFLNAGITIEDASGHGWDVVAGRSHKLRVVYALLDANSNACFPANLTAILPLQFSVSYPASNPLPTSAALPSLANNLGSINLATAAKSLTVSVVNGVSSILTGDVLQMNATDVGLFNLNVSSTLSSVLSTLTGLPTSMSGTQSGGSPITVRPFGLLVVPSLVSGVSTTTNASSASGGVYQKAGENFTVSLKGLLYNAGDDLNGDGIPDSMADNNPATTFAYNASNTTPSLTLNSAVEAFAVTANLALPSGGNPGILAGSLGNFLNGTASGAFNFSEVGIVELVAKSDSNFLTSGKQLLGTSGYLGRFIPHHFNVASNTPLLNTAWLDMNADGINDWSCSFAYFGQGLGLDSAPELTLTAFNKANVVTQNYRGAFNKFVGGTGVLVDKGLPAGSTSTLSVPGTINQSVLDDSGALGQFHQIISGYDTQPYTMKYTKPLKPGAKEVPFVANLELVFPDNSGAALVDGDNICYQTDTNGDGITDTCQPFKISGIGGMEIRYGRLNIDNSFGPEINDLNLPVRAEYWKVDSGMTGFYVNTQDSNGCSGSTILDAPLSLSPATKGSLGTLAMELEPLANGLGLVRIKSPGAGNQGQVTVTLDGPDFMQFDFNGDGILDAAKATATFGIYGGKGSPVLFQKESFR